MYKIVLTKKAIEDIPKLKNVGLDEKAKLLIKIIEKNPYQNPPSYEKLFGVLKDMYSRRINRTHRLVYKIEDANTIKIVSMWSHYDF